MISVLIPIIDAHDITKKCLDHIVKNTINPIEIIIIDNGSYEPYKQFYDEIIIRNDDNVGLIDSFRQAISIVKGDVLVYIHNDVLIHEFGWDVRVQKAFDDNDKLAIAGFFGARGVHSNGGREFSESNMLGKEWGSGWAYHSSHQTSMAPAAILDGLCMIFRVSTAKEIGFPNCPPHHWYDRIIPLYYIDKGYHCATIGIAFDHWGGQTSSRENYHQFAKKWCKENNIPIIDGNPDLAIYLEGERQFREAYGNRLPLRVDPFYNYSWSG